MADIQVKEDSPFTIHNIPFGVFQTIDDPSSRCATAIGDFVIDLVRYSKLGRLNGIHEGPSFEHVFSQPSLNAFAALPRITRSVVRQLIQNDIRAGVLKSECLIPMSEVTMLLPMQIGGYSDFYCSLEHCRNCSPMSANVVPKNWFYAPSVYNGRASSVVVSPRSIKRPKGVYYQEETEQKPTYGASQALDFELEMGYFVSSPVSYGHSMSIDDVKDHIFGFVLLNDWSARDLQRFEMTPLGPFHSKGFGTSISPWVVTLDALDPFQCVPKTKQDPPPFDHLKWKQDNYGTYDVKLKVSLKRNNKIYELGTSNLRYLYWTPFQQLTHHAAAGCGLNTGDMCGTGTISGEGVDATGKKLELGCLYEATEAGTKTITLSDGSPQGYLLDGDEVILEGWCGDQDGHGIRFGFGACSGRLVSS